VLAVDSTDARFRAEKLFKAKHPSSNISIDEGQTTVQQITDALPSGPPIGPTIVH
jgi:hypothetical protein